MSANVRPVRGLSAKIEKLAEDCRAGYVVRLIVYYETPDGLTAQILHEADPLMLIDATIRLQMLLMDRLRQKGNRT